MLFHRKVDLFEQWADDVYLQHRGVVAINARGKEAHPAERDLEWIERAQAVQIAADDAGAHRNVRLRLDPLASQITAVNPAPEVSHHGTHFTGRADRHLDGDRRISHRAAGSFLRSVVLVDMRGEA